MFEKKLFSKYSVIISLGFILFHCSSSSYADNIKSNSIPVAKSTQRPPNIYTDHKNGTITDNSTGLMWKKCAEGKKGIKCTGDDVGYNYKDMLEEFGKKISFAGYNDWRLPSIKELRTLVWCSNGVNVNNQSLWDSGCSVAPKRKGGLTKHEREEGAGKYQRPTINIKIFPNSDRISTMFPGGISSNSYYSIPQFWSASYHYHRSGLFLPYYIRFDHGSVEDGGAHLAFQVRLVRG